MLRLAHRQEASPPITTPLEQVFDQHHGLVFRTAYRITGNAADAEDVLQTVFLRLLGRKLDAAPMEQPESYLRRAAINASLDVLRQRRTGDSPVESSLPPTSTNPELSHALRQALATVAPRHAEMFILRYFEGYSNPEIARMLGISSILVAVTLHRTRGRLERQLRPTQ